MISAHKKRSNLMLLLGFTTLLLFACKKDKVSTPLIPPPVVVSKWEKIPGHYKVYDTMGVFLYEMDIKHKGTLQENGIIIDSLYYVNFDGQYDFATRQSNFYNLPNYIEIGFQDPVIDQQNDRYRIVGIMDTIYNNFVNDTIIFYFEKQNILYYIQDVTPYFYCKCKQVAVKQH